MTGAKKHAGDQGQHKTTWLTRMLVCAFMVGVGVSLLRFLITIITLD
jgi:hypothetical protein